MDNHLSFISALYKILPADVSETAKKLSSRYRINEIRIRQSLPVSYTVSDNGGILKNIVSQRKICADELNNIVLELCGGSLHAHEHTVSQGFIIYMNQRIGICGSFCEGKIRYITSLCIRILYPVKGAGAELVKILAERSWRTSVLIYSPPGIGKTTLLRGIASAASFAPYYKRVVLADSRCELYDEDLMGDCLIDSISGMSKSESISAATRTMSPEIIICDEIDGKNDAPAILEAQNTGVPLIASAHADNLPSLLRRPGMKLLYDGGIFDLYCGIKRNSAGFIYDIHYFGDEKLCCV